MLMLNLLLTLICLMGSITYGFSGFQSGSPTEMAIAVTLALLGLPFAYLADRAKKRTSDEWSNEQGVLPGYYRNDEGTICRVEDLT